MEKEQRGRLQKATQDARRLLEEEFAGQLLETFDINVDKGRWNQEPGAHLQAEQRLIREKLVAWIEHRSVQINDEKEALLLTLREMAFTSLNRFVALKLMEARELVRPCVSRGLESAGFQEFTAVAQGLLADQEGSYRVYLETIFEDVSRELRSLFDPRDPASLLWPKRTALLELLDILNRPELAELWSEDETLGWVYQYFNGDAERKKMREESSAPRNSRELAVRNQFFTPRYVVEFLTDSTLGRIWYEMRQGNTRLKERCRYLVRRPKEIWLQPEEEVPAEVVDDEALSQEELLHQPVHIPHRPLKDPREILMLDPACGSMHFGLYAFDLYLTIYAEAWEIALCSDEQAKQDEAFAPFVDYAANFADKAAFLREVPRLILLHNIHGIDIDPRATQIARLTLWLRAQRAWQEQQVEVAGRTQITRSNVVCAEPMPGERELLADFVDHQFPEAERGLVQQLLEAIFDKMKLAGEAGSLLKIEEEIRDAIDQTRREWRKLDIQQQDLFSPTELAALGQVGSSMKIDLQDLTKDFWVNIEERIYAALSDYAEQAENGSGLQRRLFTEDAARGFAFIDVSRKRYDVALMNPPFGLSSEQTEPYLQVTYPNGWVDLYACFVWRGIEFTTTGRLGAITSRSFISSKKLEYLRASQLIPRLEVLADLGKGVMDAANVEACAYTLCSSSVANHIWAVDLASFPDREQRLERLVGTSSSPDLHRPTREMLLGLPNARLLYSIPPRITDMLKASTRFEPSIGTVRCGLTTFDDIRFLRASWEVNPAEIGIGMRWEPFEKGGEYGNYYGDIHLVIKRFDNGAELASVNQQINGQTAQSRQASTYYYRPGAFYTDRSQRGFAARALPAGCVIAGNAPAVLSESEISCLFVLGWLNSRLMRSLVEMQAIDKKFYPGFVKALPWFPPSKSMLLEVEAAVGELLSVHGRYGVRDETAPQFVQPWRAERAETLLQAVERFAQAWSKDCARTRILQSELSKRFDELYGITDARTFAESILERDITSETTFEAPDALDFVRSIYHYALGVAIGRWDVRIATMVKAAPELPDPFAPLPVCPPGQLQNEQGLPARPEDLPASYPVRIPWDGIFVDDPNHPLDIELLVREVIEIIWSGQEGASALAIEQEACEILGVRTLRDYFRKPAGFFAEHLKRYSKSRRQAPIYWQLSAGNGSHSVWLYYHRFTQDTLYRVLRDFVEPRIQLAEREQFELESQGALSGDAATRLQESQSLLQYLQLLKSELDLVAPLWNPNFNDGVIINHAILWRMTPFTPWQKKCKECWDKLVNGDYDWAHLAFHLWPERVIKKCQSDRSLAIAHGLEDRFWQETNKGNWLQRQVSETELQALIAEHTKPAVQNALERFLAAPPSVVAARTRAPRGAKSTSAGTTRRPRGPATAFDAETSRQTLLVLTAAPSEGLSRNDIASALDMEPSSITPVIKQLKESGRIEQLGAARGARYRLTEQGRAALASQAGEEH
jgi:hypothetical protein